MSDVVGTVVLLAVTVGLLAVLVAEGDVLAEAEPRAPSMDVQVDAPQGTSSVRLVHAGGDAIDASRLRVVVTVGDALANDTALGASGDVWGIGDEAHVGLPSALAAGDLVFVTVVDSAVGTTLAEASLRVEDASSAPAAPTGFDVDLEFGDGTTSTTVTSPAVFLLVADVDHPVGRAAVASVTADLSFLDLDPTYPLNDDGLAGDERAGDGVYGAQVLVLEATFSTNSVVVTATDVDGATVDDSVSLTVSDAEVSFNTALLDDVAFRIMTFDGLGTSGDKVSVDLKVRVLAEPVSIDGVSYNLERAWLDHEPFKPGANPTLAMDDAKASSAAYWSCYDPTTKIMVFRLDNETLPSFDRDRDVLRYYFLLEWEKVTGGGSGGGGGSTTTFQEDIHANYNDENFVLRRDEDVKHYYSGGWPDDFDDCQDP